MIAVFGGEKGLKDPRQHLRFDSATVVADLHADITARRQEHVPVLGRLGQFDVPGLDAHPALGAQGLHGILDHLDKGLLHFGLVEFGREEFALQLQLPVCGVQDRVSLEGLDAPLHQQVQVPGGLGAHLFVLAAEGVVAAGDKINKMSLRTGVSTRALSELGYAAIRSASVFDAQMEAGFRRMQKTITEALQGNGASILAIHRLGVGLDQLSGRTPDAQFEILAEAVARVADPTQKAAAAMQIFGRDGTNLLPMLAHGAAGIEALRQEARELGRSVSPADAQLATNLASAYKKLGQVTDAVWENVGAAVADTVLTTITTATRLLATLSRWAEENNSLVATLFTVGTSITVVGGAVTALGVGLLGASVVIGGLAHGAAWLAAGLGLVVSPLGLITTLLAGGVGVWLRFTTAGQRAGGVLGVTFQNLSAVASQALGGIVDAIRAGDFELAGEVAMAALKVALLTGVAGVATAIGGEWGELLGKLAAQVIDGDLSAAWSTAVTGMQALWAQFSKGVVGLFVAAMDSIIEKWRR